jgi:S-adenosylmethionine decarboxylase
MNKISGTHLIIDGHVADAASLDPENIVDLFDGLVESLGMKYLTPPQATRVKIKPENLGNGEDDGGWSVFAQITTSHIALHGWPLRKAFMMDIFSCKPFDVPEARRLVNKSLDVTAWHCQDFAREEP